MAPVLLCDLDGTLVDTAHDLAATLNALLVQEGLPPLSDAAVRKHVGQGAARLIAAGFATAGRPLTEDGLNTRVAQFLESYIQAPAAHSRPYPSVVETLKALKADGWRLGVCTNKPQAPSETILAELDLARFFDAVGGGDTFPVRKPNGAHLHATLELMDATAEQAVLVGDSRPDLGAARDAGMPVVLVSYGYEQEDVASLGADRLIDSFDALTRILPPLITGRAAG